ncbi:MAG TPA: tetratricopeptide repeat protein [Steroidobacteraceae bacterium]|nr:tetratricopeptide repeat protein [Steroidobacteraceae bacterium]
MTHDELLQIAADRHRAGELDEARRVYRELIRSAPDHALAHFRLGLVELTAKRLESALAELDRAIALDAGQARFHLARAWSLAELGRAGESALAAGRALDLEPADADAWFALGNAQYLDGGSRPRAEAAYRRVLELSPGNAAALTNLGTLLLARGALDEAIPALERAVKIDPGQPGHAVNLGLALCRRGSFASAVPVLESALARDAACVEALLNLGIALQGLGELRQAAARYRQLIELEPRRADAHINLGNVLRELGEPSGAVAAYTTALELQPASIGALNNLAGVLRTRGRLDEAEALLRRALAVDAGNAVLHDALGNVQKDAGDVESALAEFRVALELDPDDAAIHSNLAYSLSFACEDGAEILAECRRWNARHAAPLRPGRAALAALAAEDRPPDRRLRVGYVSPDFREHCQALFMTPLLEHHDHDRFEIFGYASGGRVDARTRQLAALMDVWRDARRLDDASLSELIRGDRIDVLVDLTMHMAKGRPLAFARRPAPVQLAWLAYPGTTGMDAVDYRLSDPRLDPPGSEQSYSERTLLLPDSFWCYSPLAAEPPVNALPALDRRHVTFGCLNNPCKITARTLALWGGVMRAVPGARLRLLAPSQANRERLRRSFESQGVDGGRVDFQSYLPRPEYLRSYHGIDIGLDTLPYNGHTTSLDALWMGVPVVTRVGPTCAGRAGLSQLHQLGLTELAADSDPGFVLAASVLARDLGRLAGLRESLRRRLERSALMDGARFAAAIETAYRAAWHNHSRPRPVQSA